MSLVLMGWASAGFAQKTYRYRADVQKVDSAAFYRIALPPAVLAKAQGNLADIRLYDNDGKVVPYIFGAQLPVIDKVGVIEFPQVKLKVQPDTMTIFIAENKKLLTLNQLNLLFQNTDVERYATLSGSNDLSKWYAIKEDIPLLEANMHIDPDTSNGTVINGGDPCVEQKLNFPASNYRYFKIQVNNKKRDPIAITLAFIYITEKAIQPQYIPLPALQFKQEEHAKYSRIAIRLNDAFPINRLHLDIAGTKYYRRNVRVSDATDKTGHYDETGRFRWFLGDMVISSTTPADISISAKTRYIELEIANEDNPPLQIKGVTAYQLEQSVIAYLEKGNSYSLLVGDSAATSPNYDLKFFTDSLKHQLPVATVGEVIANPDFKVKEAKPAAGKFPPWALWAIIVAVLTALGSLTFKMTKEVEKRG